MTTQELPIFPLGTVMFPGATLTLHIFEERYRLMIGECLEQSTPFGVVLIRDGHEVGAGGATPHEIGTMVAINASVRLEDGRLLIATVGQQRFRINNIVQVLPYMTANITMLDEEPSQRVDHAAEEVRQIYDQYWHAVAAATGVQQENDELPDDSLELSHHLAYRLQVTNERKQRWLEHTADVRLREIAAMLRAEIDLLPRNQPNDLSRISNLPWSWN